MRKEGNNMEKITHKTIDNYTLTGTFTIAASVKPYKEATESKSVTLAFRLNSVPLRELVMPSLQSKRITWQNNVGRKQFDSLIDRSTIEVDFLSPGKRTKTRDEQIAEAKVMFMKAGLDEASAIQLAEKAVDNPEIVN